MRGRLQALIDYTGLSIGEAAAIIGIGHEALSRKLAGKERYDVREAEIEALEKLARWQDDAVSAALRRVRQYSPGDEPPTVLLIQYRRNDDLLDPEGPPASARRMVIARLAREPGLDVRPVVFDAMKYHDWRAGRQDTHELRARWAGDAGTRLFACLKTQSDSN